MRYGPLVLAVAVAAPAPAATAASPPLRLVELPGAEALPRVPPVAPPQPPITETPRLRGTVAARERVIVGIGKDGTPNQVRVVQRLLVRSLGDYAFVIPAPALSVEAAEGSESQPGLRPNQIVWQGFSPRRKVLAATARLRLVDSVAALPIRIRVSGTPVRSGPFELVLSLENATGAQARVFSGDAPETDVAAALDALRAAVQIQRPVEGRVVRVRGTRVPRTVDVSAALSVRGTIRFPAGAVRDVRTPRFSGVVGGDKPSTLRVRVRGVALRPVAARIRVVAEPVVEGIAPRRRSGPQLLETAISAYLRYARTRQYETYLANPDVRGPSTTTYVFESAEPERPAPPAGTEAPNDGSELPLPVVVAGLALLGLGLVVVWAHL